MCLRHVVEKLIDKYKRKDKGFHMEENMKIKKRRDTEIYENYWKFTAAHLDITGTKFNNCLNVIIIYIDNNYNAIQENAKLNNNFIESKLYKDLQEKIIKVSGFQGKDPGLSARKVINQFVKIGFVNPMLLGYHSLVKKFIVETDKDRKKIIFSKIFYECSSLASDVTIDKRNLKHVKFLLKTLDESGPLNARDIMGLMVTDITNYKAGYLTREDLNLQYQYAVESNFDERKYNQISHLIGYLKRFIDLKYDKYKRLFWFVDDKSIIDIDFDKTYIRDGIKHRIFKEELREESLGFYGKVICYFDKLAYKSLIASHIKPCSQCLKENNEYEAYDLNNGLLLNPTIDSYFDKFDISFDENGEILMGKSVDENVKVQFGRNKLDSFVFNENRQKYMKYHRNIFREKNGI